MTSSGRGKMANGNCSRTSGTWINEPGRRRAVARPAPARAQRAEPWRRPTICPGAEAHQRAPEGILAPESGAIDHIERRLAAWCGFTAHSERGGDRRRKRSTIRNGRATVARNADDLGRARIELSAKILAGFLVATAQTNFASAVRIECGLEIALLGIDPPALAVAPLVSPRVHHPIPRRPRASFGR